jgi:RHS repeat-associated protein
VQATFTGQEYDEETDIQYFGARYMDNETGRFVSIDPAILKLHNPEELKSIVNGNINKVLINPQQLNSYAYSINNPVVMTDDTGEFAGPFGRDLASGQRSIGSFFNRAGDYTSSQGGFVNKVSGFVSRSMGDIANNIADVFDPDQSGGTRMLAFGFAAFDASTGGEGKVVGKTLLTAGEKVFGLRVTKHAAEQFAKRGMSAGQISSAIENGTKYLDTKTGNLLHTVGERGRGGFTIVTDRAQKALVSTENFIRNLSPKSSPDRFKLLK